MSCAPSASGSPMPDSINSCGELMTPPHRMTSRSAWRDNALARFQIFDADRPATLEQDARRQRAHDDFEIGPGQRRTQIGDRGAAAPPVADRHLRAAEALLLRAVVILGQPVPGRRTRRHIGVDQRVGIARQPHRQRPIAAAIGAGAALPAFLTAEIGKHMGVRPGVEPVRRPSLVVAAMAAHIDHGVDRRRAADHLAAGAFDAAAVHRRLGLGEIHPVVAAALQHPAPAERDMDPRVAVPAARLEHQHARVRVLAQPIGQGAAGRSGPDDDVGVCFGHSPDPRPTNRLSCGDRDPQVI